MKELKFIWMLGKADGGVQLYVRIGDYTLKIAKPLIFPRAFP
jgi:hypothetical protein